MWRLYFREIQRVPIVGGPVACRIQCLPIRKHRGSRYFHCSPIIRRVVPYVLADIGEGITECQIISWSVKPGDKVQQFDSICEVQSDKASVEITSRFDGTIKTLHYDESEMAIVGTPLIDIDVDDAALDEVELQIPLPDHKSAETSQQTRVGEFDETRQASEYDESRRVLDLDDPVNKRSTSSLSTSGAPAKQTPLVTPAVRHMLKGHSIDIASLQGTGKDGRILKEDVQRYLSELSSSALSSNSSASSDSDQLVALSPIEQQMFNVMTRSLNIPHFLYTHTVDFTPLNSLRKRLNIIKSSLSFGPELGPNLTPLPFIMKALSLAFLQFPKLNSHLDLKTDTNKPHLLIKASHNFGIAVDTPSGLLVPVIKDVQTHSIISLAAEISRISRLAKDGKLGPNDFKGATFIISNIGSIGGSVVGPVIVEPMVGILGVGQARVVPAFRTDDNGVETVIKKEEAVLSWSADHRVLDGAIVARCAKMMQDLLKNFELISTTLK